MNLECLNGLDELNGSLKEAARTCDEVNKEIENLSRENARMRTAAKEEQIAIREFIAMKINAQSKERKLHTELSQMSSSNQIMQSKMNELSEELQAAREEIKIASGSFKNHVTKVINIERTESKTISCDEITALKEILHTSETKMQKLFRQITGLSNQERALLKISRKYHLQCASGKKHKDMLSEKIEEALLRNENLKNQVSILRDEFMDPTIDSLKTKYQTLRSRHAVLLRKRSNLIKTSSKRGALREKIDDEGVGGNYINAIQIVSDDNSPSGSTTTRTTRPPGGGGRRTRQLNPLRKRGKGKKRLRTDEESFSVLVPANTAAKAAAATAFTTASSYVALEEPFTRSRESESDFSLSDDAVC